MEPWETPEGKQVWKSKSEYFQWLRGALRRLWSDYPLRQVWKKSQLRPVTEEEKASKAFHPSTKNVGQCYYCKKWFAGSKLEVDHKEDSDGCKNYEEAEKFLWYCGGGTGEDWVLADKECHKLVTMMSRYGLTFEEAKATKKAILVEKVKTLSEINGIISDKGILPASNAKGRRQQLVSIYLQEEDNA